VLTAWGATDDQGNRLKATAESQDAINEDGERIPGEPLFLPETNSRDDLKSRVRTELSALLTADDLTGRVEIIPKAGIRAGYSYQVPELDDKTLALESVRLRGDTGTLAFESRSGIASRMSGLSGEVSSVKDAFQ